MDAEAQREAYRRMRYEMAEKIKYEQETLEALKEVTYGKDLPMRCRMAENTAIEYREIVDQCHMGITADKPPPTRAELALIKKMEKKRQKNIARHVRLVDDENKRLKKLLDADRKAQVPI
jgi:hypothetical protein